MVRITDNNNKQQKVRMMYMLFQTIYRICLWAILTLLTAVVIPQSVFLPLFIPFRLFHIHIKLTYIFALLRLFCRFSSFHTNVQFPFRCFAVYVFNLVLASYSYLLCFGLACSAKIHQKIMVTHAIFRTFKCYCKKTCKNKINNNDTITTKQNKTKQNKCQNNRLLIEWYLNARATICS